MTSKNLHPQPLDDRHHQPPRGTFRHATNRQVQLALQGEVQELTRKSLNELNVKKELKQLETPTSAERTIKHLAPEFVPDRHRSKRKLHPIFHDDSKKKEARDKSPVEVAKSGVPPYNALDREKSLCKLENEGTKSNRYPHRKDQKTSVEAMQKPHVSSVGVVPSRSSEQVDGLRIRLEGQPAVPTDQDPVLGPVERANTAEPTDQTGQRDGSPDSSRMGSPLTPVLKPAIVASRGTIGAVPMAERAKPASKPRSRLKPPKSARAGSAGSVASSLRSVEIHIPSGKEGKTDDARSSESNNSLRSVKDLLEEAKQMVSPEDQAILRKKAARDREALSRGRNPLPPKASSDKKSVKSGKSGWSDGGDDLVKKSAERSVDEIIASLKDQSKGVGVSEADRKIQEIMQRVLSRTAAVLGGVEEAPDEGDTSELAAPASSRPVSISPVPASESHSTLSPVTPVIVMHSPSDEDASPERTTTRGTMEGVLEDDITMTETTEPISLTASDDNTDMPSAIVEALEKLEERTEAAGSEEGKDEPAAALVESVPRINVEQFETEEEPLDLAQCYEDLHAPSTVHYEDIISVQAKPSLIHIRDDAPPAPETADDGTTTQPATLAFLSSWQPLEGADTPRPAVRKTENSVHHFCTMTGDVQLPDHLRGTWRRYHVPSKYNSVEAPIPEDFAAPTRQSVITSSRLSAQVPDSSHASRHIDLDRVQSAAATRIMEEAYPEETFEEWRSRAEEMFGPAEELSITGRKMDPVTEHSTLFWKPAPPKWDVPPAQVKHTLFPHYDGAALVAESEGTQMVMDESSEEEEEEEVEEEGMDPDDMMAIDRTLNRRYHSARDLTRLLRTRRQHEQDLKAGKVPAAPETVSETLWTVTSAEGSMAGVSGAATSRTFSGKPARTGDGTADLDSISEAGASELSSSVIPQMPVISFADMRARFSQAVMMEDDTSVVASLAITEEDVPVIFPRQRRHSAPGELNRDPEEDSIMVYEDFTSAMEEISKQRQLMKDIRDGKVAPPNGNHVEEEEPEEPEEPTPQEEIPETPGKPNIFTMQQKKDEPTPAELALEAGRAYVLLPQKRKKKKKHQLDRDVARIEAIQNFLVQEPTKLTRTVSNPKINIQAEGPFRVSTRIREKRTSVTSLDLDEFNKYLERRGFKKSMVYPDKREFAREIWNKWFDHTFPPTPAESDWEEDEEEEEEVVEAEEDKEDRKASATSTVFSEPIDMDPIIEDDMDMENNELMQNEVDHLTKVIEATDPPSAFHIARRGALHRKLGKIKSAQEDLDLAIKLEPMLIDSYWHRHLLFLLQNKKAEALSDLNAILKHNKKHAGAYRSRATIYRQSGDITMAIVNFTQAIKLDKDDYEAYYQRAEMYEKRGEMLLAMEDYAVATRLMPSKTEALFKHGMHYFNNGNWQNSINDFTELLKQDPGNAHAHMYRGRAFAKLKQWNNAVGGLSASIHLDPNNKMAFYYRGCILRRLHPKRALQDFSVSLMIDDSEENLLSYLHRGILYNEIGRHEDAIPDFEACLKLDKDMAVAHVNLGLIFMLKMDNYHRAIKKFTQAIKSDPTYVKAYVCRAEAYTKIHEIKSALLDFTRAIHLRPDVHHYYMYRGQLVLRMGNLDLAAFCVKHAAEMNAGLGSSATQQAIVQSFLKNFDKAIVALEGATRVRPIAPLFVLLGKTHMKARMWKQAVASFERALEIVKRWQTNQAWPPEAAEMYYLIGMCQVEQRDFLNAHDAFNNSIRVDQNADAYYWRGMTKMRLKQSKGIQDFNRALSINPKLFQAYLSRAAFYGMRGQNTKAILNCNEAIKLQPRSVRAYLYRGALKYHIRAYKLAIMDLTTASEIDSRCALAYFSRAVCYQDSGYHQKALQDYGIVLLLGDALKLKVLINRGLLYFDRKDYRNALQDFQLAAGVSPFDKRIHHTLGLCHHKLYQLREAVESFSKALKSDPFFLDAYLGRGNVFMDYSTEVGLSMARRDYERALRLNPCCVSAQVNLGYNLQVCGRYQLAWNQFTAAITIQPDFQPALEGRAIVNLQMSNTFAAFQDISASVAVKPTAELLTNRGVIYQFMGDRNLAMRDYQHALKLDTTYALAYFNAANVYFHMRQFKQALAYYHQALQYDVKDESALLNRAITKVMLRDAKGALADFERAIKLSPHSAHMYFNRANLYCSMREYEKAELDYTKALELQPDDALVLKRRADVRGKLSMKAEAVKDYQKAIKIQTMRHK